MTRTIVWGVLLFLSWLQIPVSLAQADSGLTKLKESFAHPPDDCRIMMRWWWFGPVVAKTEIQRELEQMKAAGIGGVEIATLYPLALDDPQTGFRNLTYLSEEHIDALRFAAAEARALGMRTDITLGSGWPFGGPHIPITQAAGEMRVETVAIPSGARSIAIPSVTAGEQLVATFWVPGSGEALAFKEAKQAATSAIENGRLQISPELSGRYSAVFFISSRTGMMVKRPAVGAEGFVLDHYDQKAIATHLHSVGDHLMKATCGPLVPNPRMNRPLERASRVAVVWASRAGVRLKTFRIPVPSRMRVVRTAIAPRTETASNPQASGTHTESKPSASARRVSSSDSANDRWPLYGRTSPSFKLLASSESGQSAGVPSFPQKCVKLVPEERMKRR